MAAPPLWLLPAHSAAPGTPVLAVAPHPASVTVLPAAAVGGGGVVVAVALLVGSRLRRGHRQRLARQSESLLGLLPPDRWDPGEPGRTHHPAAVVSVGAEQPYVRLVGAEPPSAAPSPVGPSPSSEPRPAAPAATTSAAPGRPATPSATTSPAPGPPAPPPPAPHRPPSPAGSRQSPVPVPIDSAPGRRPGVAFPTPPPPEDGVPLPGDGALPWANPGILGRRPAPPDRHQSAFPLPPPPEDRGSRRLVAVDPTTGRRLAIPPAGRLEDLLEHMLDDPAGGFDDRAERPAATALEEKRAGAGPHAPPGPVQVPPPLRSAPPGFRPPGRRLPPPPRVPEPGPGQMAFPPSPQRRRHGPPGEHDGGAPPAAPPGPDRQGPVVAGSAPGRPAPPPPERWEVEPLREQADPH